MPALALSAIGSLVALGNVVVPRHLGQATRPAAAAVAKSVPRPEPMVNTGDCLNDTNHNPTFNFDVVRLMRTPGAIVTPILDRTVHDQTTAARLAHETAAWPALFEVGSCRVGPLGQWYALSFAAKGDLNDWAVFVPGQFCDAPSAPPLCADMTSLLGIARSEPPRLVSEASVHIVRTPGLLILPRVDETIADSAVATRLADDIRSLRPWGLQIPGGPALVASCPVDYGTSYTLAFAAPETAPWTATVGIFGCSLVSIPTWPSLLDFGTRPVLNDLGSVLQLSRDELAPIPCSGGVPAGHRCYQQPSVPTSH